MAIIPAAAARLAPAAGAAATDLAVRAIRPALCGLYRQNPGWYTGSPSALGRDIGRVASFALDNLCSDQPLPPPQTVPFQGGQCRGVSYRVTFRVTNPKTGITSTFVAIHAGSLGGIGIERIGTDTDGMAINRFTFVHSISATNPNGTKADLSNGRADQFRVTLEAIARQDGLADTCGNPPPSDPPAPIGDSVNVNINLPDLRISPTANVVIPVVIFKPQFNINPQLNVEMKINFDFAGQKIVFDGSDFRTGNDVDIDFTSVNNQITSTQNNINSNTNTQITNSQNNINSNIVSNRNTINSNTNTAIANSQTAIVNNTNTAITNTQTNINTNTNSAVNNSNNSIINTINNSSLDLSGKINALALILGVVNANVDLALKLINEVNLKPDCPEPLLPPGDDNVDDIEKPEEPKTGNNPKIQAVTIVITQNPVKSLWGGGNGAPDKLIAGWFAWKVDGYGFLSQEHINYSKSTFIRPLGVSGYAYTLTNSARGFAIEHTLK